MLKNISTCITAITGMVSFSRHMAVSQALCAGHSKWANIKHIKGSKDAERAELHQRLFRSMKAVIREHGSADPKQNMKLAHFIDQARHHNVPADKIQQVLKIADQSKEDLKNYILEVRGPGGSFFVLEVLTHSLTKTKQGINTINRKLYGSWADGIANNLFSHKGFVKVLPLTDGQSLEQALDHAIEIGAEDVTVEEDGQFRFSCSPKDFFTVQRAIKSLGYTTTDSDLLYTPLQRVSLGDTDLLAVEKLYEKLKSEQDVLRIHDNIE